MAATVYPWAPTVDEIAKVVPNFTAGGFDDDEENAGAMQGSFTDSTEPTASEVEDLITAACDEVSGRVGMIVPAKDYALARTTAKWHVAATITGSKQPSGTEDASGSYRGLILNYRNSLDSLVELARMPAGTRLQ